LWDRSGGSGGCGRNPGGRVDAHLEAFLDLDGVQGSLGFARFALADDDASAAHGTTVEAEHGRGGDTRGDTGRAGGNRRGAHVARRARDRADHGNGETDRHGNHGCNALTSRRGCDVGVKRNDRADHGPRAQALESGAFLPRWTRRVACGCAPGRCDVIRGKPGIGS